MFGNPLLHGLPVRVRRYYNNAEYVTSPWLRGITVVDVWQGIRGPVFCTFVYVRLPDLPV